jgi:hypothetical protein
VVEAYDVIEESGEVLGDKAERAKEDGGSY